MISINENVCTYNESLYILYESLIVIIVFY